MCVLWLIIATVTPHSLDNSMELACLGLSNWSLFNQHWIVVNLLIYGVNLSAYKMGRVNLPSAIFQKILNQLLNE